MSGRVSRIMNWQIPNVTPVAPWWKSLLVAGSAMAFICLPVAYGVLALMFYVITRQWIGLP